MCRFGVVILLLLSMLSALGADYRLSNGDILRGEAVSYNDDGLVVSLEIGGFSPRVPWGKLTQETLRELAKIPEAEPYVEPYIEIPIEVRQAERARRRQINVVEPPRVPKVEGEIGLFASLMNPLGLTLLLAIYLANLYAAYEIARFRARPIPMVVGVSAVVPIIGPAIFALLPSGHGGVPADSAPAEAPAAATDGVNPMQQALPPGMQAGSLGLAAAGEAKGGGNPAYSTVYNRSNTTFERRFFETKFAGFFRVVPAEPEKSLVMVIKTAKQEVVASRVSRISGNEVHFFTQRNAEVAVPFGEIVEVSVKPKGAK